MLVWNAGALFELYSRCVCSQNSSSATCHSFEWRFGVCQQVVDVVGPEQLAAARRRIVQDVANERQERAAQVFKAGTGK